MAALPSYSELGRCLGTHWAELRYVYLKITGTEIGGENCSRAIRPAGSPATLPSRGAVAEALIAILLSDRMRLC